jgi:hypothetical protein
MRGGEPVRDLRRPGQRFARTDWSGGDLVAERFALEQLHDQIRHRLLADVEQRAEIGVIERRDRARFILETPAELRVAPALLWQNLDGHGAVETGVESAIHVPHAAGTDLSDELIRTETRTAGKGHCADGNKGRRAVTVIAVSDQHGRKN